MTNTIIDMNGTRANVNNKTAEKVNAATKVGAKIIINKNWKTSGIAIDEESGEHEEKLCQTNNGSGKIKHIIWAVYS